MRTLPAGLAALIGASGQQPTLSLVMQDVINRFALVANNGDGGRSSVIKTAAGSVLRARVTQGADPNSLAIQRMSSPLTWSQWGAAYPAAVASNCRASAGCALVQRGSDNALFCFYQSATDQKIKYVSSTNDGQSWSAETDLGIALPLAIGNFCYGIAANWTGSPAVLSVYAAYASYDPGGNCGLYRSTYSGGAWSAWSNEGPATPSWGKMRGLCGIASGATDVFACGVQLRAGLSGISAGSFYRSYPGGVYTGITTVQALDNPNLGLSCAYPDMYFDGTTYYETVTLADDGSVSGVAGNRTTIYISTDLVTWSPWQHFGQVFSYGAHTLMIGQTYIVCDGGAVYSAPAAPAATDLSGDVIRIRISEAGHTHHPATIEISNASGAYTPASFAMDARLTLSLGYVDPVQGALTVQTHKLILEGADFVGTAVDRSVTLHCRDAGKVLDYPSARLRTYTNLTVAQIVSRIGALAGLPVGALPGTSQFGQVVGCFLISPGETLTAALDRASAIYDFVWWTDGTGTLRVVERSSSDASTWTYTTQHQGLSYAVGADQANVIRVIGQASSGSNVFAQVLDGANLLLTGLERYRQDVDRMLDTSAKCLIKANLLLHDEQAAAVAGTMGVPLNPAHELMDVVTVTDTGVGISGTKLRINGVDTTIDTETATWGQVLHLEGP